MSSDQQLADLKSALTELTDSNHRLVVVIERNTNALTWLAAMEAWCHEPWWRRGPMPHWPQAIPR